MENRDSSESPFSILIVEDEPGILDMLSDVLGRKGYKVFQADHPDTALKICAENSIDLLIADFVLPGMNGKKLLTEARKIRPEMSCLFMSGFTENVISENQPAEKGIDFIHKPFSLSSIQKIIRQILERKNIEGQ